MKHIALMLVLLAAPAAHALEAACEKYLEAAEKSAKQPTRHAVTDGGGLRSEAIVFNGKFYLQVDGKWREMKFDFTAAEQKIVADARAGKIKIADCKVLGSESIEGVATTILGYVMTVPGLPVAKAQAYIGKDGLIYAQVGEDSKIRYRYTDVKVPL